ncbi:MAG TPA: transglutaminase family protein [Burkholderiaceae bacterium]|jgi:transglutaminase-like putative cysteine protease|nr:transglutaminase family protein [Burkholderiaceae bacterium]HRZ00382.1 transglutaminase family protein [Burkholderiaceae bacterium]
MLLSVLHRTVYRYSRPAQSTVQTLRVTPRAEAHQRVVRWRLTAPGALAEHVDAYGNATHTLALHAPHDEVVIEALGEVEVDALDEGALQDRSGLPAFAYLAATPLTEAGERVREFTARHWRGANRHRLLELAQAVFEQVRYAPGHTDAGSSAERALELGRGVCQDHAHLFIAACRARGVPARYVSGYYYRADAPLAASHAWADAWVEGQGWVSYDITHRGFASDQLARLAVGRDYDSAGPVRGVRLGGGEEALEVRVNIRPLRPDGDRPKPGN